MCSRRWASAEFGSPKGWAYDESIFLDVEEAIYPSCLASMKESGDVNGDGRADVIATAATGNALAVYPGNGHGGFLTPIAVLLPAPPGDPGFTNKLIERRVAKLDGHKSLYSESFYDREEFDLLYGGENYRILKKRYDPDGRLLDLYSKAVKRQ